VVNTAFNIVLSKNYKTSGLKKSLSVAF